MSALIIDGNRIAQDIRGEVADGVKEFKASHGYAPGLAAVLVGDDPASAVYVRNKERACAEVGIFSETFNLPQDSAQSQVIEQVQKLNRDDRFHGILVQLPLPPHMDERLVIASLDPDKDVDGLHPVNMGRLMEGRPVFVPGTPAGVQQLLVRTGNSPEGKSVVVCGRSDIVGKPVAMLLMQKQEGANATVTVCHTGTRDLPQVTRSADILIAAMGRAKAITADMVKEGCGHRCGHQPRGRLHPAARLQAGGMWASTAWTTPPGSGDVDYEEVSKKAAAITPVPGGVGPMTVAMLLSNTLKAAQHGARTQA